MHNVAASYGKTATFMPKPVVDDNGSGMHVHQSVWKDGNNLFAGRNMLVYQNLRFTTWRIIKHARALNAFTNQTRTHISAWSLDLRPLSSWHILQEIDLHQLEYRM